MRPTSFKWPDALKTDILSKAEGFVYNYTMLRVYNYRRSRRGPLSSVLLISIAFFSLSLFLLPATVLAQPRIVFEKEAIDFGKAVSGTEVDGRFKMTNKGDQPLEIEDLRPG